MIGDFILKVVIMDINLQASVAKDANIKDCKECKYFYQIDGKPQCDFDITDDIEECQLLRVRLYDE